MTETVRRAIRVRLEALLENHEKAYENWLTDIKPKLNRTRQKQVEREFRKTIQAVKITVNWLKPFWERTGDVPTFVIRKEKKDNLAP